MHVVETPEQLKAFTDPLRNQVLAILAEREATNQQIADLLGQPQAKVLYHIRVLLQEDLIRLVDTQVKGGNVEKYYRAIARLFSLRPGPETFPALVNAGLEVVRQEVAGSTAAWPDQPRHYESRNRRIAPEQVTAFFKKLQALISQEWDGLEEDPDAPLTAFVALSYRDPTDVAGAAKKPAAVKPAPVKPAAAKAAGQKPAVRKAAKEQPKPRKRSTKKRDG
jgi:DNA-binding transcriptional ArsR family regulator